MDCSCVALRTPSSVVRFEPVSGASRSPVTVGVRVPSAPLSWPPVSAPSRLVSWAGLALVSRPAVWPAVRPSTTLASSAGRSVASVDCSCVTLSAPRTVVRLEPVSGASRSPVSVGVRVVSASSSWPLVSAACSRFGSCPALAACRRSPRSAGASALIRPWIVLTAAPVMSASSNERSSPSSRAFDGASAALAAAVTVVKEPPARAAVTDSSATPRRVRRCMEEVRPFWGPGARSGAGTREASIGRPAREPEADHASDGRPFYPAGAVDGWRSARLGTLSAWPLTRSTNRA